MEFTTLALMAAFFAYLIKSRYQRHRIALLARELGQYRIEALMEQLTEGYQRALAETEDGRRLQIWQLLEPTESSLAQQFARFAQSFGQLDADEVRVSTLPIGLPYADRFVPGATFDLRLAFAIHAQGFSTVVANAAGRTPQRRAFVLMAEMLLMQHTCHWYCRSKTIASARLLARHHTAYEQVVASVDPTTRAAYRKLVGG